MNNSRRGLGVVEIVVAALLGAMVLLGLTSNLSSKLRFAKSVDTDQEFLGLVSEIRQVLAHPDSCLASLNASPVKILPVVSSTTSPWRNQPWIVKFQRDPLHIDLVTQEGAEYAKLAGAAQSLKVTSLRFIDEEPVASGNGYLFTLQLTAQKPTSATDTGATRSMNISIYVAYDAANIATSCSTEFVVSSGLECATGKVSYASGSFVGPTIIDGGPYGRTAAEVFTGYGQGGAASLPITFPEGGGGIADFWGILCNGGWQVTGCAIASKGTMVRPAVKMKVDDGTQNFGLHASAGGKWDNDLRRTAKGCYSDEDEIPAGSTIYMSCCRNIEP